MASLWVKYRRVSIYDITRDHMSYLLWMYAVVTLYILSIPIAGLDFTQVLLNVTFGPSDTSKHIRIPILDDNERENNETFYGNLIISPLSESIARVTTPQAAIEILYNDCKY